jgi:hypothetical protein
MKSEGGSDVQSSKRGRVTRHFTSWKTSYATLSG